MGCRDKAERRKVQVPVASDARGGAWTLPTGRRLPGVLDEGVLVGGDPEHPARLREADLDRPEAYHARLKAWILNQG